MAKLWWETSFMILALLGCLAGTEVEAQHSKGTSSPQASQQTPSYPTKKHTSPPLDTQPPPNQQVYRPPQQPQQTSKSPPMQHTSPPQDPPHPPNQQVYRPPQQPQQTYNYPPMQHTSPPQDPQHHQQVYRPPQQPQQIARYPPMQHTSPPQDPQHHQQVYRPPQQPQLISKNPPMQHTSPPQDPPHPPNQQVYRPPQQPQQTKYSSTQYTSPSMDPVYGSQQPSQASYHLSAHSQFYQPNQQALPNAKNTGGQKTFSDVPQQQKNPHKTQPAPQSLNPPTTTYSKTQQPHTPTTYQAPKLSQIPQSQTPAQAASQSFLPPPNSPPGNPQFPRYPPKNPHHGKKVVGPRTFSSQQEAGKPSQQEHSYQPQEQHVSTQEPYSQKQSTQMQNFQTCEVAQSQKVPCGNPVISAAECEAISCCFDGRLCHFGKAVTVQCTKDAQFIVVVARDATLPNIDLESISLLDATCSHTDSSSAFAIYQFPVTGCGSVVMEEPGVIIYENRMTSSYEVGVGPLGAITRDSYYELLFQCRYTATSVETLVVQVLPIQDPPLSVAAMGPIRVHMRLANGQCHTKGCNEEDVAYSSFYTETDYPVTKVLRDPVYVEVQLLEKTDPNLVLTLGRCWTTTSPNPHSLPQWDILIDGCPYSDDRYLSSLVPVGAYSGVDFPNHYRRFIFKMFTFVNHQSMEPLREQVYIHCSTSVCTPTMGYSCEPSCYRKSKRDAEAVAEKTEEPKVVTSFGPVIITQAEE